MENRSCTWLLITLILACLNIVLVICDANITSETSTIAAKVIKSGTFRLMDGSTSSEGRVEVYHNGSWGTVCSYGWDIKDAQMVCRSLGYLGATGVKDNYYGRGTGIIWLSNVDCPSDAVSLHFPWGEISYRCFHSYDIAIACTQCQVEIGGIQGINCKSCSRSGIGKCDPLSCPPYISYYNNQTKLCEEETMNLPYECEEDHGIASYISPLNGYYTIVSSKVDCVYLCIISDYICMGVDYVVHSKTCRMFNVNKYTASEGLYIATSYSHHCSIGLCSPGQAMNINKTCDVCPVNHYKHHRGSPCLPCKLGYDTKGMIEATECSKTCAAGSYSREGVYCETCPEDTFKNKNDGSSCLKCPKSTTTGGKIGQTQCKSQFQHYMNEYGFYYIGVLSGFLTVLSCCWNLSKKHITELYSKCCKHKTYELEEINLSTVSRNSVSLQTTDAQQEVASSNINNDVPSPQILDFMRNINEQIGNINDEMKENQQAAMKENDKKLTAMIEVIKKEQDAMKTAILKEINDKIVKTSE